MPVFARWSVIFESALTDDRTIRAVTYRLRPKIRTRKMKRFKKSRYSVSAPRMLSRISVSLPPDATLGADAHCWIYVCRQPSAP